MQRLVGVFQSGTKYGRLKIRISWNCWKLWLRSGFVWVSCALGYFVFWNRIKNDGVIRVCPFFKIFFGHNPLLVDLDELNWMVPEFSKLDIGKLLLAGVLYLVTWHSRDRSRDLVTTINSNCGRLSAKIARMGCRSFEHSAPIYSYTTWSWFNYSPLKSNRMYMFTFEILIIILLW